MTTPNEKIQGLAAAVAQWFERSGLKARVEPQLARYRALEPEKKKQILTGLIFAVIAANLLLVLAPIMASYFGMDQKIQKIASEATLARKDIAAESQMVKALDSSRQTLVRTEKRIFKSDQVHQFLDLISNLAKESNVKIESLTPVAVNADAAALPHPLPKGYTLAGFELLGNAGYHELGALIARLESGEPFVRVDSINIYHEPSGDRRTHQVKLGLLLIRRD